MRVELVNRSDRRVPLRRLGRTTRRIVRALERLGYRKPGRRTLIVAFVPDVESQRLNRLFLKKSGPADVLSFDYGAASELILAPRFIQKQARPTDFAAMIERLIAHGAVHLAGLHHERSRRQARRFDELEHQLLVELKILNPKHEIRNHRTIPNEVRLSVRDPALSRICRRATRGISSGDTGSSPTSRSLRSRKLRDKFQ